MAHGAGRTMRGTSWHGGRRTPYAVRCTTRAAPRAQHATRRAMRNSRCNPWRAMHGAKRALH
eukprot:3021585-Lingulodinium_polyedra.AAC.1